jgi:chain length determinant protein EpsF
VRQDWLEDTKGKGTVEDWLAELLLNILDINPSPESSVHDIVWKGADPQFAALVSNAFAEQYIKTNLQLQVEPARQNAQFFDEQLALLRDNLEKAQSKMNEYQRDKGYSSADERLDVEQARLAELSTQYTSAQAQAADAASRQQQLKDFLDRGANPETLPDVLANPLINSLKTQVLQTEARLEQISSQLGANHPEVQKAKADIGSQRQKLKAEIVNVTTGITNNLRIASQREASLRQGMAEQKARLMRLNQGRDQLSVLAKEVDSAQRAYDTAAQRLSQTNLESKNSQTNISILTRAIPPLAPSFPRLTLNLAIAIALGIILGSGLAFLREMADRRVRSIADLVEIEGIAVIGHLYHGPRRWTLRRSPKRLTHVQPAVAS